MRRSTFLLSAVTLVLLALGVATPARAQTYTNLGASTPTPALSLSSFAYDDKHHVYLHVYELQHGCDVHNQNCLYDVYGRFVGADGTILGAQFVVTMNRLSFGLRPRVAYSRGSGADVFMVTYTADQVTPNVGNVFGQLVQYTGAGPTAGALVGSTIAISPNSLVSARGTYQLSSDVVYNPQTSRFFVAWEEFVASAASVYARTFNTDGSPATAAVNASPKTTPGSQGAPAVAYDWQRNEYFVAFSGDHPNVAGAIGVFGNLVDGTTGAVLSNMIVLSIGFNIEPAVTYLPEADGFLPAWTNVVGHNRTSNARFVPSTATSGILNNAEYVVMSSTQPVGAPALDYDYVSRRVLMTSMRAVDPSPGVIAGTIMDAGGGPLTGTFNMSTVPAIINGTLVPTVRPAEGGIFGLSYINDSNTAEFERFLFPAAQTPGLFYNCVSNCQPPPPTDTDGDGVPDYLDSCPTVFAQTANGCPAPVGGTNGDFTGDNRPEVVWQNVNASGQVYAWSLASTLMFNSGTFLINDSSIPSGVGWTVVGTSDLTGDGKPDLLWQNTQTGQVILFIMNGTTKVGEQQITTNLAWHVVATGDFNGDGNADIAWQNFASGQIYVWFMSPSSGQAGLFSPFQGGYIKDASLNPVSLGANSPWFIVGTGDVNGDGKVDLLWQNSTNGNLSAWYLQGLVYQNSPPDIQFGDTTWKVRAVGDYNGDGHPDLIFQKIDTGDIAAWLLNGTSLVGAVPMGRVSLVWQIVGAK